jgi:WD40 repeat protein
MFYIQSFGWSYDGSVLLSTSKDKMLRQFDIRKGSDPVSSISIHGGNRNSRAICMGNSAFILTCGHSATQDREYAIWDNRNMKTPIKRVI